VTDIEAWEWLIFSAFFVPLFEVTLALVGCAWGEFGYRGNPSKFEFLVIQITTVGKEPELVQRAIDSIRGYGLTIPYVLWVCIEPEMYTGYTDIDRLIVVPKEFTCNPVDKARALEYTRRLRVELGWDRKDVKVMFVDDDTLPSKRYIEKGFAADYDVCQGITIPSRWYAIGNWQHFLMSHLDDPRVRNCIVYCSITQGLFRKPLYVHGEGLTVTGWCESRVTWDFHIVGSDDLVFGTNAATMGMQWGFFNAAIQLVSPWTLKEHLTQRWRWTWGNIDAIRNREVMPRWAAWNVSIKYLQGYVSTAASLVGIFMIFIGAVEVHGWELVLFLTSFGCWIFSYGFCGWLSSGGAPNRALRPKAWRYWGFRVWQAFAATLMTPITAFAPMFIITYSVFRGRPKRFVMIKKHNAFTDR
jgi:hypothetical protein